MAVSSRPSFNSPCYAGLVRRVSTVLVLLASSAFAHKGSDSYWRVAANGAVLEGRLDVAVRDVNLVVPLDGNSDGDITFAELEAHDAAARALLSKSVSVRLAEKPCAVDWKAVSVVRHSDGLYASWPMVARCDGDVSKVSLGYGLLFDVDAQHRGLVQLSGTAGSQWLAFSSGARVLEVNVAPPPVSAQFRLAVFEGAHHLAIGWDHLCFLFALLLPSVLRREGQTWRPAERLRSVLSEVAKVVTAFTVAHSVTLGLAAFDVLTPNTMAVEAAIAVSVVLAALNTVFPVVTEGRWTLAFGLGLLHGFGFVSALSDAGLEGSQRWLSVAGFNLGIELGQLAIVAVFVPLVFSVRRFAWYPRLVAGGGLALTLLAARWTVERLTG